jgi:glycosyltransferase involved in cell wall biosynthesis
MIRLYGNTKGNTSWPRVTKGIQSGLEELGKLAGLCEPSLMESSVDDSFPEGYDAPVGLYVGPPNKASVMQSRGVHEHRLVIIAANSSWLPAGVMRGVAKTCTGLVGPSRWACSVLEAYSQGLPVYLFKHGVSPEFVLDPDYRDRMSDSWRRRFEVLHLASTNMQRKGTRQLVLAWGKLIASGMIPEGSKLRIVVAWPPGWVHDAIADACVGSSKPGLIEQSIVLSPPRNLSENDMRRLMQQHHVVCQPSRAEGFGMVPVEARACGVPVVATSCTGHGEHMMGNGSGVVHVGWGDDEPIDDGPGAMAPRVTVDAVVHALEQSYLRWPGIEEASRQHASYFREKWSWRNVTEDFLDSFEL